MKFFIEGSAGEAAVQMEMDEKEGNWEFIYLAVDVFGN